MVFKCPNKKHIRVNASTHLCLASNKVSIQHWFYGKIPGIWLQVHLPLFYGRLLHGIKTYRILVEHRTLFVISGLFLMPSDSICKV